MKGLSNKPSVSRMLLLVVFVLLEIFIVLYFLNDYRHHDRLYREEMIKSLDGDFNGAAASYDYATQIIFDDVVSRPEVLRLIAAALDDRGQREARRDELYRLMLPSYERQKTLGIWQFHFHLKDGTSFLRMHAPDRYGDNLFRRPAVKFVNTEKKRITGYEMGYFADGYRYMYPLLYNGRHIGSVEFSITSQGIIDFMKRVHPGHYYFIIDRSTVDHMTYEEWHKLNFRESSLSDRFMTGNTGIEDRTVSEINQRLKRRISSQLPGMEPFVEKEAVSGIDYMVAFLPVKDVTGKPTAYLVYYITDELLGHYFTLTVIDITLFSLLLASVIILVNKTQVSRRAMQKTMNALHESENRFRGAFDNLTFGAAMVGLKGRFLRVNQSLCRMLGYSEEEMLLKTFSDITHPEDVQIGINALSKMLSGGSDYITFEKRYLKKDGTAINVIISPALIRDNMGSPQCFVSMFQDITERKRAEKALIESEKKYRDMFESATDAIFILDLEGNIIDMNSVAYTRLGYTKEEMLLMHIRELDPPEFAVRVPERLAQIRKNGFAVFESAHIRKNGTVMPVEVNVRMYEYEGKKVYLSFVRDISERRKAEDALLESEEIFRNFMEYSPIYVFFKDEHIRSVRLSRNYETMLGRPIDELLGKSMDELFPSDLAKSMVADDMRILKEGKTISVEEEFNGRLYSTVKFPIYIEGRPRYLAGFTIDITERRRYEQNIANALAEKETLLREIHHRVKNNMQVITSLLKLQAQKMPDKDMKKPFEESEQRIRAMALVHERLYQKEDLSGINFSPYLHDIIKELKIVYRIDDTKVAVKTNIADIVLGIDTAIPCGLIINELITNCFKYAFPEEGTGEVMVSFIKEGNTYRLTIRDNGTGLPDDLDYRQSTTLGIQIVTVLAKQLMGTLHISSEGGTVAVITFPEKKKAE